MELERTNLPGVFLVKPSVASDARGRFCRIHCKRAFEAVGIQVDFVNQNISYTAKKGTIRGLHFQAEPFAEAKLIRCIRGRIFDVLVDVRPDSNTFGQWQSFELGGAEGASIYCPEGFAHGFQTLEPDCEVLYSISNYYSANHALGILWNDEQLGIPWPLYVSEISERDRNHPRLRNIK